MSNVSTIGTSALSVNTDENELRKGVSVIEQQAQSFVIVSNEDYKEAGRILGEIKDRQSSVTKFFEPMRKKTYDAYKEVTERKKAMLKPLDSAEKIMDCKMRDYREAMREQIRQQEEAAKKLAQQEMERKLQEAIDADSAGDSYAAEAAFAEAEVMDNAASAGVFTPQQPKADGVSVIKEWEIVQIDSEQVPVSFGGVELRPVDERAVKRLIKASKGTISIPGVKYKETDRVRVRR